MEIKLQLQDSRFTEIHFLSGQEQFQKSQLRTGIDGLGRRCSGLEDLEFDRLAREFFAIHTR